MCQGLGYRDGGFLALKLCVFLALQFFWTHLVVLPELQMLGLGLGSESLHLLELQSLCST